eukprot:8113170-Alexandrium_andersonii.AAC.1
MDRGSTLIWAHAERCNGFLPWPRMDSEASHFMLPTPDAPGWHRVVARETVDAVTGSELDFQSVYEVHEGHDWRGPLPASTDQVITRFWCILDPADRALPESMGSDDPRALES